MGRLRTDTIDLLYQHRVDPDVPGAAELHLAADDLAELDDASASVQVQGDRYPEAMRKMIDR